MAIIFVGGQAGHVHAEHARRERADCLDSAPPPISRMREISAPSERINSRQSLGAQQALDERAGHVLAVWCWPASCRKGVAVASGLVRRAFAAEIRHQRNTAGARFGSECQGCEFVVVDAEGCNGRRQECAIR